MKHVCNRRCMESPPENIFQCKCSCNGAHHGAIFLARLPWARRQQYRKNLRAKINTTISNINRTTEFSAFIKESQTMAEIVGNILTFEKKGRRQA